MAGPWGEGGGRSDSCRIMKLHSLNMYLPNVCYGPGPRLGLGMHSYKGLALLLPHRALYLVEAEKDLPINRFIQ